MKKKLLFYLDHCSSGGGPQYILKMIQTFKEEFDISVIEHSCYSLDYVVQRNQIKELVPFYPLFGKEEQLMYTINQIKPDIIHTNEIPNKFLSEKVLSELYSPSRNYNIVVTSHSSLTRRKDFTYLPDRIVAVNKWQKELFEKEFPDTQIDMWEYPIEDKKPTDEQCVEARLKLNIDPFSTSQFLNVGLWTPGKNQGELLEIARQNPQNTYHFVGNQAENFRSYWEPLMRNKPKNCIVWGERADVELFYQACDSMYFCSKFELNPIVLKEGLSYGLPITMRRLPSYGTDYDNIPNITFIK